MKEERKAARSKRILTAAFIVLVLVAADQAGKYLAECYLKGREESIRLIPGILELHYLYPENRGMAFGLLQGNTAPFAAVSLVFFVLLFVAYLRTPASGEHRALRISFLLIMGGAMGNFIDRAFRGYVIDFLNFSFFSFPVFNTADVFVVCGGILFLIMLFLKYRGEHDLDFLFQSTLRKTDESDC